MVMYCQCCNVSCHSQLALDVWSLVTRLLCNGTLCHYLGHNWLPLSVYIKIFYTILASFLGIDRWLIHSWIDLSASEA